MQIGFVKQDSFIHRLNPSLKFIAFIVIIAMIFLPLGFFAQLLIGLVVITIYFSARLSVKKLWNILKSILFLFLILFLINWCIYKYPIALNIPNNYFSIQIGNINHIYGVSLHENNSYVSNLIGGDVIGFLTPNSSININGNAWQLSQLTLNESMYDNANKLFNSLNDYQKYQLLVLCNNDKDLALKYIYVINNGLNINGVQYSIITLSNSDNGLLNEYSAIIYKTYWYTLSPKALQLAIYVSIKVFLMILAATILTSTTSSLELTYALEDILTPLKIFKFPVTEVSMMIAIALRFVPSLLIESQRVLNAQSSRGIDFKNGNFLDKSRAIVSLIVPLFSISFQKSMELANAMDAKSYNPRYARTRYRFFSLTIYDWICFGFLCLLFGFLIGITINKLIFCPFGIFELGTLLD